MFVLVTGLPGSGKASLAAPLAAALGVPFLSKDTIKEALWDGLGPGDRTWGTQLGRAAAVALESLAQSVPAAVIDHFVHADHTELWAALPRVVEVRCACAPEIARKRYAERLRHPCHFDSDQLAHSYDGWLAAEAGRPAIGARLDVDTASLVDVGAVAQWVTGEWARLDALTPPATPAKR